MKTSGRRYKYGIPLPKNVRDAIFVLDIEEGNHLWRDSIKLEHDDFDFAKVFCFLPARAKPPKGYK